MTGIVYTVPGATSSAFMPVPAGTTSKIAYKMAVSGQPGTQAVPAGPPDLAGQVNGQRVSSGYSGGSSYMPGVWFPQLYFERELSELPPVSIYSDNQMPVPAADPRGTAARLARPPVFLGQSQLTAGKGLPRWANWLPSGNYGG
jgi:hypothetical protein